MYANASILSNKLIKTEYNVDENDFPREIECRQDMLLKYNQLMNDHSIKDKFIDYLLIERKKCLETVNLQKNQISEIESLTKDEMKNWMDLTDRFVHSLETFKLKCVYCGIPLHQQSVNSFCELNNNEDIQEMSSKNLLGNINQNGKNQSNQSNRQSSNQLLPPSNENEFGSKGSGLHYFVPFNS